MLENQLLHDEKQCAEHIMLVDLGRNDVGKVNTPNFPFYFLSIDKWSFALLEVWYMIYMPRFDKSTSGLVIGQLKKIAHVVDCTFHLIGLLLF